MNNLDEILGKITDFLRSEAKTETIIGQQFKLGEFTCLPVMSIGIGVGGGSGEGTADQKVPMEGVGGGGGVGIGPVGFLVSRGDKIEFIPTRTSRALSTAFEKLPDLLDKYLQKSKQKEKETA